MKYILILILALLTGCASGGYPIDYGNAMRSFSEGYNNSRDRREARTLQRAQTQYYQNQNANQWRNY